MIDNLMPKRWSSAQGERDAKVSLVRGLKGLCHTPVVVCVCVTSPVLQNKFNQIIILWET